MPYTCCTHCTRTPASRNDEIFFLFVKGKKLLFMASFPFIPPVYHCSVTVVTSIITNVLQVLLPT